MMMLGGGAAEQVLGRDAGSDAPLESNLLSVYDQTKDKEPMQSTRLGGTL